MTVSDAVGVKARLERHGRRIWWVSMAGPGVIKFQPKCTVQCCNYLWICCGHSRPLSSQVSAHWCLFTFWKC